MRAILPVAMLLAALTACDGDRPSGRASAGASVTSAAPSPSPAPASSRTLYTFDGIGRALTGRLDIVVRSPSGQVLRTESITLPEGPANTPNTIFLHTLTASWQGVCGALTLCGQVTATNDYAQAVTGLQVIIDNTTPSSVTAVGAPWVYGDLATGATSAAVTWVFSDPTSTDFVFRGHVAGTVGGAGDAGVPSDAGCTPCVLGAAAVGSCCTQ